MSDQPTQLLEPSEVQTARSKDAPPRPYQCGDPLPLACDTADLARIYGKSRARIRQLDAAGRFKRFELREPVGTRRWSGLLIKLEFETPPSAARSFGAKRPRV